MNTTEQRKTIGFILLIAILLSFHFSINKIYIASNDFIHAIIELFAAFICLYAAILGFIKYYYKKTINVLIISSGLLLTSLLKFNLALTLIPFLFKFLPASSTAYLLWSSFSISTIFTLTFSISLILNYYQEKKQIALKVNEMAYYSFIFMLAVATLASLKLLPLTTDFIESAYTVLSVLLFSTLVGYWVKGDWKKNCLNYFIVYALICECVSIYIFQSTSYKALEFEYELSTIVQIFSFTFIIIGLFTNIFKIFKQKKLNEQRLEAILNSMVDSIITIDISGNIKSYNPMTEVLFGYSEEELNNQNINALIPEMEVIDSLMPKLVDGKLELTAVRKNNTIFPVEMALSEIYWDNKTIFIVVIRDITQHKEVAQLKNDFVSIVSHELRTPLTSIRGSLGLLAASTVGKVPDEMKNLIDIAYNNSSRLVLLINDILDIEKIESGKMNFKMTVVELSSLINECIAGNSMYAAQYGVVYNFVNINGFKDKEFYIDKDNNYTIVEDVNDIQLFVDKNRLMQVITNLLSNAAKFSNSGDTVDIIVSRHEGTIRVSVKDYGQGMPEKFKSIMFEKFAQADSSTTRAKGGSGLGLNICKAIIEKMHGSIYFETELGKGSTFSFELPLFKDRRAAESNKKSATNFNSGKKILICEDDKDVANLIQLFLGKEGYKTDIAYTARELMQNLEKNNYKYDAITLDLVLPDKDGISMIKEIQQINDAKQIPIIVVSIMANKNKSTINGNYAVVDWINKPIDQNKLIGTVKRAIREKNCNEKPLLLHVDDNPDILEVISFVLKDIAQVEFATTIDEAELKIKEKNFDIVILDFELKDGVGTDLIKVINNTNKDTAIVIFSAYDIDQKTAQNVDAVLLKSVTSNQKFLEVINTLTFNK